MVVELGVHHDKKLGFRVLIHHWVEVVMQPKIWAWNGIRNQQKEIGKQYGLLVKLYVETRVYCSCTNDRSWCIELFLGFCV